MQDNNIWREVEVLDDNYQFDIQRDPQNRIFQYYSIICGCQTTIRLSEEQYSELSEDYLELSDRMKSKFNYDEFYFIQCILSYNW